MNYQYLFCASCGTRRAGHGYQCSVCGSLLRHDTPRTQPHAVLSSTLRYQPRVQEPAPERQPVTARAA